MNYSKLFLSGAFILLCISCKTSDDATTEPIVNTELTLTSVIDNYTFDQPIGIENAGDGSGRIFIVEKEGIIKVANLQLQDVNTFLNISQVVNASNEMGLLGLAFHPDYVSNGYFYVNYNTADNLTRISRFSVSNDNVNLANANSEVILLEFPQNDTNHNGGQLSFGTDGYLYISSGDGGGGNQESAQDLSTLAGAILRIDVNNSSNGLNYSIPVDNPFVNEPSARGEIFAYGLRNPWRMSFDEQTGKLWAGDVGAGDWEEIDIIESGANYGWPIYEASNCNGFFGSCDTMGLTLPVFEYPHDNGNHSITGGFVYRGSLNPSLVGKYVYADLSGKIWCLDVNSLENTLLFDTELYITTFGLDSNKELFLSDFFSGQIYKFEQAEM